jgi:DNA repair protein SbcC/Rad50
MLDNLFKSDWKSSSVEKRLKAVSELDGAVLENQEILTQLATQDEDVSVRLAAIQKLTSAAALYEMSKNSADDSIRAAAEKRFNEALSAKNLLDEAQYRELLDRYPELMLRVAAHAGLASVRTQIIENLSTPRLLEVLGITGFTDTRQRIAEKLTDIGEIESAIKIVHGKDKTAEGILKTKLEAFRKQEQQQARNSKTVEELIAKAEFLAGQQWQPGFKYEITVNRQQWDTLDFEIEPALLERYQAARAILDARYDEHSVIEQAGQAQEQLVVAIEAYLREMAARDFAGSIDNLAGAQAMREQFRSKWRELSATNPPDAATHDKFDKLIAAMQYALRLTARAADIVRSASPEKMAGAEEAAGSQETNTPDASGQAVTDRDLAGAIRKLEQALEQLKWPSSYGELKIVGDLRAQLKEWNKALKESAAERKKNLDLLHEKINSIFRFSRSGNLARAKQLCERVEKKIARYEGRERSILDERFQEARKALDKMGDWNRFATEPKYLELCEAMEALASSGQHPEKLSSEMKALQQQWKALGHSDCADQYWPRFKQAADIVYKPCADYFAKRKEVQKANLEQRGKCVEEMQRLLDGTDWDKEPDLKSVLSSLRRISDAFATIKDVERNAGRKQWERFSAIRDQVNSKLDVVCKSNLALKHELIAQAEALAAAPAAEINLVKLKSLQEQWKRIGIVKRNQEQKAWIKFKEQTDLVYNKVQELRRESRDNTDRQLGAYGKVIREIQQLAGTAQDLVEADRQFAALEAQYSELPELPGRLPEKLAEGIQRDYRNACRQFSDCRSRIINNLQGQRMQALRRKADLCARLEALGTSPPEEALREIAQEWDSIALNDAALSRRIEARRNSAQAEMDRAAIGDERRMLCIQLEIALDVESPAEDKALRMQYQLEQLNKSGLGARTRYNAEQLENVEVDWLCKPGAEPERQKELDKRFREVLQAGRKRK